VNKPRWPSKAGVAVLAYCIWQSLDLLDAWTSSPRDRFAWFALCIWVLPVVAIQSRDRMRRYTGDETYTLYGFAVVFTMLGQMGTFNTIQHFGLLLAVTGLMRWSKRTALWLATGVSWMPVYGWLTIKMSASGVIGSRIMIATLGATVLMLPLAEGFKPRGREKWKRRFVIGGSILAIMVGSVWQYFPLAGAETRLVRVPTRGEGFMSCSMPILPEEQKMLGRAVAFRRRYCFINANFAVSVVDATLNRHAAHDPSYCIRGAGWQIVKDEQVAIRGGHARKMSIKRLHQETEILFWFSDGEKRHASFFQYWAQTTLRRLSLGGSGPEPVMIIIQRHGGQPSNWDKFFTPNNPILAI
jgi:hypothetical protein